MMNHTTTNNTLFVSFFLLLCFIIVADDIVVVEASSSMGGDAPPQHTTIGFAADSKTRSSTSSILLAASESEEDSNHDHVTLSLKLHEDLIMNKTTLSSYNNSWIQHLMNITLEKETLTLEGTGTEVPQEEEKEVKVPPSAEKKCDGDSIQFIVDVVHTARRKNRRMGHKMVLQKLLSPIRFIVNALQKTWRNYQEKKRLFQNEPIKEEEEKKESDETLLLQEALVPQPPHQEEEEELQHYCDGDSIKFIVDVVHTARRQHKKNMKKLLLLQQQQPRTQEVVQKDDEKKTTQPSPPQQQQEFTDGDSIKFIADIIHPSHRRLLKRRKLLSGA